MPPIYWGAVCPRRLGPNHLNEHCMESLTPAGAIAFPFRYVPNFCTMLSASRECTSMSVSLSTTPRMIPSLSIT